MCVESNRRPCECNRWYMLSATTFLVGVVGLTAVCLVSSQFYVVSLDDYTSSHSVTLNQSLFSPGKLES